MTAEIIDGKAIAQEVRDEVRDEVEEFTQETGHTPGLATILVGDDPASAIYVAGKQKDCVEVGIKPYDHRLPKEVTQRELAELINELNSDHQIDGVLLQLPLPNHLNSAQLIELIDPDKDVDGLTITNAGRLLKGVQGLRSCTPLGIMELLSRQDVQVEGSHAVVLGRSQLVGKPVAQLLTAANATVTVCHSRTRDLPEVCAQADVLIAAVGVAQFVRGYWINPGTVVIDVGITRTEAGLVGDVNFEEALERASAITPVPGGVGPMTRAMLLRNTLDAARLQSSK